MPVRHRPHCGSSPLPQFVTDVLRARRQPDDDPEWPVFAATGRDGAPTYRWPWNICRSVRGGGWVDIAYPLYYWPIDQEHHQLLTMVMQPALQLQGPKTTGGTSCRPASQARNTARARGFGPV